MKTILFFDDWMVQYRSGLQRRWHQAYRWPGVERQYDPLLRRSFDFSHAKYDCNSKTWRMWAGGRRAGATSKDESGTGLYLYESTDGLRWQPYGQASNDSGLSHEVFRGDKSCAGGHVLDDLYSNDPEERYKLIYCDPVPDPPDITSRQQCRIATSPDGVHWNPHRDRLWNGDHVDTYFSALYNPYSKCYQWTGRVISGDRRIALYQTVDWRHFNTPQVIIAPDSSDPPGIEFYGMPIFYYEGYFLGILWKMHGSDRDCYGPHRMRGYVDNEWVYSLNGMYWNRCNREPLLAQPDNPANMFGMNYTTDVVSSNDQWLRIYNTYFPGEHHNFGRYRDDEPLGFLEVYQLRKDGFCSLGTASDYGTMVFRPVLARSGQIMVNCVTGRFGRIRAELRMVPHNTPVPGYEFENSIPVEGDHHNAALCWKDKNGLDPLSGLPFRLCLEIEQGGIFAVRMDCDYIFEGYIHNNLAGDYQPPYHDFSQIKISDYTHA